MNFTTTDGWPRGPPSRESGSHGEQDSKYNKYKGVMK